jgi:hypothetical protein
MKTSLFFYIFILAIVSLSCSNNNQESFKGVLYTDVNGVIIGTSDINNEDWKFNVSLPSKINNLFPSKLDTGISIDSFYISAYPNPNQGFFNVSINCKPNSKLNLILVDESLNILFKGLDYTVQSNNFNADIIYTIPPNKPILRLYYQIIYNNKETKGFGDIQTM